MMITMKSGKVSLRELSLADKSRLAALADNPKIRENVRDSFPNPYREEDAVSFIRMTQNESPGYTFAVCYQDELAGVIGMTRRKGEYKRKAEVGYWIGEPYWNKGIATAAVKLIVDYGFSKLDLEKIETGVYEHNKASRRVLEKCGFEQEGILKNSVIKNNRILSELRFGIRRKDKAEK